LQDTNSTEFWNGSAWTAAGTAPGLVLIEPTTIANSGGTATKSGGGVTYTGVTSVSLNSVFSATYENYRIIVSGIGSTTLDLFLRLRASGTDNSASNYKYGRYYVGAGASLAANNTNNTTATSWNLGEITTQSSVFMDMSRPFESSLTTMTTLTTGSFLYVVGGQSTVTTSYDGISLIASTGNITGTVRVYGYKNS
jgi:hypothetical protein